ncbi:nacht domain-containing protein [Fusarium coicis]|nr:nacht domain-containing protein [Fusarium coicis]
MDLTQSSQAITPSKPKEGDQILQNAINSFRTVLTPEQLAEFECIQSVPDTDAVLVFTAELDLQRQNQKGKSIASRLYPVLQAVHNFTSIIDTFVSLNPTIAALVWGSVKMMMMIMLNAAPYYKAFVELCMELGRLCPSFNAAIIQCCRRVIAMPQRSTGWTSPLNPLNLSFWQTFQQVFETDLQKLRDHSKNVNKEARQKRYPKSAEWIFGTDEFKRWVNGTTPGFLWCTGKMGSGKSIICASVIDYLLT